MASDVYTPSTSPAPQIIGDSPVFPLTVRNLIKRKRRYPITKRKYKKRSRSRSKSRSKSRKGSKSRSKSKKRSRSRSKPRSRSRKRSSSRAKSRSRSRKRKQIKKPRRRVVRAFSASPILATVGPQPSRAWRVKQLVQNRQAVRKVKTNRGPIMYRARGRQIRTPTGRMKRKQRRRGRPKKRPMSRRSKRYSQPYAPRTLKKTTKKRKTGVQIEKIISTNKAGLFFPIPRISKSLKRFVSRMQPEAGVFLTAVLEYITAEVIEICGKGRGKSISLNDLLGMKRDKELLRLLKFSSQTTVKNIINFATFIRRIAKLIVNKGVQKGAIPAFNHMLNAILQYITKGAVHSLKNSRKKVTLKRIDVKRALRWLLRKGSLLNHALTQGDKAVDYWRSHFTGKRTRPVTPANIIKRKGGKKRTRISLMNRGPGGKPRNVKAMGISKLLILSKHPDTQPTLRRRVNEELKRR